MSGRVVHWQCEKTEHLAMRSRHGVGGLTIHEGAWAYCDRLGGDDTHRWVPTGGVPLEALVRWASSGVREGNGNGSNGATKPEPVKQGS